jgi:hypothetical protein
MLLADLGKIPFSTVSIQLGLPAISAFALFSEA